MELDKVQEWIEDCSDKYMQQLAGNLDSEVCIQILVSVEHDGNTHLAMIGKGNYYGRLGMAKAFLTRDDAKESFDAVEAERGDR